MITNKKKLVVFHPALPPYRIDVFNVLNEKYNAVFYFSNRNLLSQNFDQERLQNNTTFQFNLLNKGFNIKGRAFRFGIFSILNKEKPEIVICSEYNIITLTVFLYKVNKKKQFKLITINDDNLDIARKCKGLRRIIRDYLVKNIDGVIVTNQDVGEWYKNHLRSRAKIYTFPVIQDEVRFRIRLRESVPLSEQYVKQYKLIGKTVFLYVGRLAKVKNLKILISAFSKSTNEENVLMIVGEGSEESTLLKIIREQNLKNIIFTGRLEGNELLGWYNVAQIFILPSTFEPFGAVVNEALMSGCYTLCSKIAGASSLIMEDINGNTFDPYNEGQLSSLIRSASSHAKPITLPIELKFDLMPFNFKDKIDVLLSQIG
jgi:glycosyltransferase involved in cell wall biosynthesis